MSPLPNWHPLLVHFPIALVLSATALLLAARLLRNESLAATAATVGTWNLCLGAVAAVVALGSGLAAVLNLDVNAGVRSAISVHVKWAMLTSLLLVLLAVWRGAGSTSRSRPSWVFLVALLAASTALSFTAYRGGMNVYEYGVGVRKIAARSFEAPRSNPIESSAHCAGMVTVNMFAPPGMVMVKALLAKPLATEPSGSADGVKTVAAADQPFGFAGSIQIAKLTPRDGAAPTVPPKLTLTHAVRVALAHAGGWLIGCVTTVTFMPRSIVLHITNAGVSGALWCVELPTEFS